MKGKSKALLIILDGWGLSPVEKGNAPFLAKTPTLGYIYSAYPKTSLSASGLEVGLSPGEPGNSEVGHMNLGSGRVVWEKLPLINQSIDSKEFYRNPVFLQAIDYAKRHKSKLHLVGLVSDGGVHSHIRHLLTLVDLAAQQNLKDILIHFITDGRDTAPKQALSFVDQLEANFKYLGVGQIATVIGRYFAMDRDKNWDRTKKAYELLTQNTGQHYPGAAEAISRQYASKKTDEFLEPAVIGEGGVIGDNDAVIFLNFRSDRMHQITDAFTLAEGFAHHFPQELFLATMMPYRKNQSAPAVFPKEELAGVLAEVLARAGLRQYHVAETEKYAHVTYFFNGGREGKHEGEAQVLVPSKKVATYDQAPAMSAAKVTAKVKEAILAEYDFIVVNYANGDMVGHTGQLPAAITACEVVDASLAEVLAEASAKEYKVIITADHGNCETMIDEATGGPNKEHTANPVPFIFLDFAAQPLSSQKFDFSKEDYFSYAGGSPVGILADVAPSILVILGIAMPGEMAGMDLTAVL